MDNKKINKKLKKILFMICMLSCINVSTSYASVVENFNFKNITIEDGLSQATVKTIFQDSKGYIWIGTEQGILELDEDLKLVYDYRDTIGESIIYRIYDDSKGNLWVSTDTGLCCFYYKTEKFKSYTKQL